MFNNFILCFKRYPGSSVFYWNPAIPSFTLIHKTDMEILLRCLGVQLSLRLNYFNALIQLYRHISLMILHTLPVLSQLLITP